MLDVSVTIQSRMIYSFYGGPGPPLRASFIVAAPSRAREARAIPVLVRGKRARFRFADTTEQIRCFYYTTFPVSIQVLANMTFWRICHRRGGVAPPLRESFRTWTGAPTAVSGSVFVHCEYLTTPCSAACPRTSTHRPSEAPDLRSDPSEGRIPPCPLRR